MMLFLFLFSFQLQASQLKVAVLDSGFNFKLSPYANICETGHKNFTESIMTDDIGHGTNVSGLIDKNAPKTGYCQIIYKVFDNRRDNPVYRSTKAFQEAYNSGALIINYSGAGMGFNMFERDAIIFALNKGITIVVAAGNSGVELTKENCNTYPACYDDRIIVVGNLNPDGSRNSTSNYGPVVDAWEMGTGVDALGVRATGTSQATAIFTGKLIKKVLEHKSVMDTTDFLKR